MERNLLATKGLSARTRLLLAGAALLAIASACSGAQNAQTPTAPITKVKNPGRVPKGTSGQITHIIVVIQENRSLNHLFNGFPGAMTTTIDPNTNLPLSKIPFYEQCDPDHSNSGFRTDADYSTTTGTFQNDGWGQTTPYCPNGVQAPPPYSYVDPADPALANYWALATQYALGDMTFQMNQGPSFTAHQYLIAGQSGAFPVTAPPDNANVGNPVDPNTLKGTIFTSGGCDTKSPVVQYFDFTIDYTQVSRKPLYSASTCHNYNTIFDVIKTNPTTSTWKYYTPAAKDIWSAPIGVQHLYNLYNQGSGNIVASPTFGDSFYQDITSGSLPNLSYIVPCTTWSDHPNVSHDGPPDGPNWVGFIVNAIGKSQYWQNSVIIVVWDDWGGWYDSLVNTGGRADFRGSAAKQRSCINVISRSFRQCNGFVEQRAMDLRKQRVAVEAPPA